MPVNQHMIWLLNKQALRRCKIGHFEDDLVWYVSLVWKN